MPNDARCKYSPTTQARKKSIWTLFNAFYDPDLDIFKEYFKYY